MLVICLVNNEDVVYDLGCGDGTILIEAAKNFGAKGVLSILCSLSLLTLAWPIVYTNNTNL